MASRRTGSRAVGTRFRASRLSGSRSRAGESGAIWGKGRDRVRVIVDGLDVTPQSLLPPKGDRNMQAFDEAEDGGRNATKIVGDVGAGSMVAGEFSGFPSSVAQSGDFGFSRSGMSSAGGDSSGNGEAGGGDILEKLRAEEKRAKAPEDPFFSADADDASKGSGAQKTRELTEEELDEDVSITLTETATTFMLSIRGLCVMNETDEHTAVTAQNEKYDSLVSSKATSDNFAQRNAQTFNFPPKNKEAMAAPPATRDSSCSASTWDIYDNMKASSGSSKSAEDGDAIGNVAGSSAGVQDSGGQQSNDGKRVEELVAQALATDGCLLDLSAPAPPPPRPAPQAPAKRGITGTYDASKSSSSNVRGGSRMVSGNVHQGSRIVGAPGPSPQQQNTAAGSAGTKENKSEEGGGENKQNDAPRAEGGSADDAEAEGPVGYDARNGDDAVLARRAEVIMSSSALADSLATVERAISQNVFHAKNLLYRGVPSVDEVFAMAAKEAEENDGGVDELEALFAERQEKLDAASDAVAGAEAGAIVPGSRMLERLWSYKCSLTSGKNVSCIAFNPVNKDLVAVSYGQYEFSLERRDGLVCLWSPKNPMWPERVLRSSVGATCLDWSKLHPNLLAVGYYDGNIAVFDLQRENDDAPVLQSEQMEGLGKHTDAVWQIKWVDRGSDRGESIVTISTDGRVTEWSIKKGLTCSDLIVLKRIQNEYFKGIGSTSIGNTDGGQRAGAQDKNGKRKGKKGASSADQSAGKGGSRGDGIISRQASGLCFDFPTGDGSIYFAGTEDGIIHKCSVSYNEHLDSFFGHASPVYRVRCSPFSDSMFLSCSADWTVKLWHTSKSGADQRYMVSFQVNTLSTAVTDVKWSTQDSAVFGSVTADGRVLLWNVKRMDPIISHVVEPDFSKDEVDEISAAEGQIKAAKTRKEEREAAAADPLQMMMSMKRKKNGEDNEEEEKNPLDDFDIEGAEKNLDERKSLYTKLTCLEFSPNVPIVLVGAADGSVGCYRIRGLDFEPLSSEEQTERLNQAVFGAVDEVTGAP